MGYLPEAMRNYLLRLGWSHGDDEIMSDDEMIAWFDLGGIGRAPARFDFAKLESLNAHYMRQRSDAELLATLIANCRISRRRYIRAKLDADRPAPAARRDAASEGARPRRWWN